jgi:small GTP-binding protein
MTEYKCISVSAKDEYDFILKCIIVGDANVGKTSILHRLTNQRFLLNQTPTIGIDFGTIYTKLYDKNQTGPQNNSQKEEDNISNDDDINMTFSRKPDKYAKVQLWDCAGQLRFRSIVQSYFRQAQIVFFVYDTNNYESFRNLSDWIITVDKHIGRGNYVGCIIGNKSDLSLKIELPMIEKFCELNKDFTYYPLSAKTDSIEDISVPICESVLKSYKRHLDGKLTLDKPFCKDTFALHDDDDGISNVSECIHGCVIL